MKFLTLLIFIIISHGLSGQGIIKVGSGLYEYKYGDLYYSYQELKNSYNKKKVENHKDI